MSFFTIMLITPTEVAVLIEFLVAIILLISVIVYYFRNPIRYVDYILIGFALSFSINASITVSVGLIPQEHCFWFIVQGTMFAVAEAINDAFFVLRVCNIDRSWRRYIWLILYIGMDIIPRIVAVANYIPNQTGNKCALILPTVPRLVKVILNTLFVGFLAIYFLYTMAVQLKNTSEKNKERVGVKTKLASITVTSTLLALAMCIVRSVLYIPYTLNSWPEYTGILIPLEMIVLSPLLFCSVVYGTDLKVGVLEIVNNIRPVSLRSKTSSNNLQQSLPNKSARPSAHKSGSAINVISQNKTTLPHNP